MTNAWSQEPVRRLPDWLQAQALRRPLHPAIETANGVLTYEELLYAALSCAASLYDQGLCEGQRAAVLLKDSYAHTIVLHALIQLGAILVPLNWRLSAPELAYQVEDCDAQLLIYDAQTRSLAQEVNQSYRFPAGVIEFSELQTKGGRARDVFKADIDLTAPHCIVYTSGTTGRPKGAVITYQNHWWSAMGSVLQLGLRLDERWLVPMPLFHVGGMGVLLRSLIYGTTVVAHNGFDVERVDKALAYEGITLVSLVPAMLARLLDKRSDPYPDTLRAVLLGGGPAPKPLLERALALRIPINQSYGLTESNTQVATLMADDALAKVGSSGKPLANVRLAIDSPDGPTTLPRVEGEILVQSPTVIAGYFNQPMATEHAFRDGWLHTGDIGVFDDDGFLYVLDRRTDLIVSGGENVYPAEVESALMRLAGVQDAGVVAQENATWGQVPVAFVVLKDGVVLTDETLAQWRTRLRELLAHYKIPQAFYAVSSLPRNASGKLLRRELREWVKTRC
ncbi:2-succinylbenzoate--CoA ligase [Alicyclobacillus hesperidum subsp. aegles]|uniref:o-succinylbenzoate--CoA ligase n=1 Tax=Alicyclobacillus hesperidum TaxID=89784 RepID=UPI002229280F|nr:o-succinylbenzoate--CoA ligase [Alicyclobacillus hesperidum]GLG00211.1 2-succinylbenzoate--CoA ligase [Alicyclobacillus hesperidum subsp. aegles]